MGGWAGGGGGVNIKRWGVKMEGVGVKMREEGVNETESSDGQEEKKCFWDKFKGTQE
jgi:hypothetical protein